MANRLTRIYTRAGDGGETRLASGERVRKHDPRIEASGTVDETNCAIGIVLSESDVPENLRATLGRVQNELFDLGGELSLPEYDGIDSDHVRRLEQDLDELNAALPPLKEFVLPGGSRAAASCHLARAVCRRAERTVWSLADQSDLNPELARYLNRLSDLLFVAARVLARMNDGEEVMWSREE